MQGLATRTANSPVPTRFQSIKMADSSREQMLSMASMLVSLVDLRDCYTGGHSTRVAEYSHRIALEMGLSDDETIVEIARCSKTQFDSNVVDAFVQSFR